MSTDPMLDYTEKLSINTFPGDGSTTVWNLNFAGGYIRREHVKAYVTDPDGNDDDVTFSWIGDNQIQITPAVADDWTLTVYRDTPKDTPAVDFTDNAIINEPNLDAVAKQSVFSAAEVLDRLLTIYNAANTALANSQAAIDIASATVGGDFTLFARTNVANSFSATQTLSAGMVLGSNSFNSSGQFRKGAGSFGDVYTTADFTIGSYSTTVQMTAAINAALDTAADDATSKANVARAGAISVASTDATDKVNAAKAAIQVQLDWLYLLSSR